MPVTLILTPMQVTQTLTPMSNPGYRIWKVDPTKCFVGWEVGLFFVSNGFFFLKFPLFLKLNENGHSWKSLAPNSEQWKIDIFEKIAYIANSLFRTFISAKFSFVGLLQKVLYKMQKFRSSKEPKTHFWQQVLILNSRGHFYNWRCFFHQEVVGKKFGFFHSPKQALLVVW